MNRLGGINAALAGLVALALTLPGPMRAASPSLADEELDEVLVEGSKSKPIRDPQKAIDWLARLVGSFTIDGSVDLQGRGKSADLIPVQGRGDCIGFGIAPAVQCELHIRWPEAKGPNGEEIPAGVSAFDPAMVLYGVDQASGIASMSVDSTGISEGAVGDLFTEDMLVTRTPCAGIPGNCERVVRITARPDLKVVEMKIDLQVDFTRTASWVFVMHRVPGSSSIVYGRKQK